MNTTDQLAYLLIASIVAIIIGYYIIKYAVYNAAKEVLNEMKGKDNEETT